MKYVIAFFLLMALCVNSYGQLFFYFQSKLHTADNKPLAYRIFLRVANDGTAAARIIFKDPVTGKNRLVKQNYIDNDFPDNSSGDAVTYLLPFGNAYNEADAPEKGFATPRFQFNKPKSMLLADAAVSVSYSYNNQRRFLPVSGSFKQEWFEDLAKQKTLMSQFFSADEEFYKDLFNVETPGLSTDEAGRKIFLLAIAATDDPKIGPTTKIDLQKVKRAFITNAINWKVGFQYQEITGKNFTKQAVNDTLDHLQPGPKDIVIVYYSGHGFRYTDDVSPFPRMALVANAHQVPDSANVGVEEIYNRILKKGALVNIVLADCCNENYGKAPPAGKIPPPGERLLGAGRPRLNLNNFRALFLPDHPVTVLACAAEINQLAAGNEQLGGFFTNFLMGELCNSLYEMPGAGEASWTRMLNNAREYTRRQALTAPCKGGPCDGDRSLQQPDFKVNAAKQ